MGIISGLILLLCSALAILPLISQKYPKFGDFLQKLVQYQNWIGFISAIWGAWVIIYSIFTIRDLALLPLGWLTNLSGNILLLALGLILGYSKIQQLLLVKASDKVKQKTEEAYNRLIKIQQKIGGFGIFFGLWVFLYNFIKFSKL